MNILQRMVGGFLHALALGVFLAPLAHPVGAENGRVQPINGRKFPAGSVQPYIPNAGRPFSSPPAIIDRSPPLSERPFAKPFLDQGPSMADRPLAPIGSGAPGATPPVWCQGTWMRADAPSFRCPAR
jgi:hypothetical protein